MSASITCSCGLLSIPEAEPATCCPACGRELASEPKDRWGADPNDGPPVCRTRRRLVSTIGLLLIILTGIAVLAPLFWVVPEYLREPTERAESANNLRQIAFALRNYYETKGRLPPAVVYDKEGRPLYSWRVLLLPFLNQSSVNPYEGFNLAEAWDSPTNLKVLSKMPKEYALPSRRADAQSFLTHYQVLDGPYAVFNSGVQRRRIPPSATPLKPFEVHHSGQVITVYEYDRSIEINLKAAMVSELTLVLAEVDEPVPWTKPQDLDLLPFDKRPLRFGNLRRSGVSLLAFCDGSVRPIHSKIGNETIRAGALVIVPVWSDPEESGDFIWDL